MPYPNPMSNGVTIPFFTGPEGADVQMEMIDMSGRPVKTLVDGHYGSGLQTATWDAMDKQNNRVSSGMYLCRFRSSDGMVQVEKLMVK